MSKKNKQARKKTTPAKATKTTAKRSSKPSSAGSAAQKVLNVTAMLARLSGCNNVSKEKMIAFVKCEGVTGNSTIRNALAKHKKAGLLVVAPKVITITEEGLSQADINVDLAFANNEEYQKKIQEQMKLKPSACELMQELVGGRVRNKKEVAAALGMKMNSTWRNLLTPLKKLNILAYDKGTIQLTDDMFPFGRPGIE